MKIWRLAIAVHSGSIKTKQRLVCLGYVTYPRRASGVLSKITAGLTGETLEYTFAYDSFDRVTRISVAGVTLAKYEYVENTGLISKMTYGENLYTISYTYDIFGRVEEIYHAENLAFDYVYNKTGNLSKLYDYENSRLYVYDYDVYDRAVGCRVFDTTTNEYVEGSRCGYDSHGRIKWESAYYSEVSGNYTTVYGYHNDGELLMYQQGGGEVQTVYGYDGLNRLSNETVQQYGDIFTKSYTYMNLDADYMTNLVETLRYTGRTNNTFEYDYDIYGNISSVTYGGKTTSYEYDDLGQLTRENNEEAGKTYVYEYDSRGNILSRKTYDYTIGEVGTIRDTDVYLYSGDRLMSYDGSMNFQYDAIGNPTLYFNSTSSGDIYTFNWEKGRQLASGDRSGTSFSYTYDADGIRTSKTVGNTTYKYYTSGGQLQAMTISNGSTVTTTMQFYYNALGTPVAFKYNGTLYYYFTNLQGDVIGIIDDYGVSAYYVYDAWGNIIKMDAATNAPYSALMANPLRYRGYIYDTETGFYYLQSRYYDPEVGRFINADGQLNGGFLGNNMYAYCNNNPVICSDQFGTMPQIVAVILWKGLIGGISGGIAGGIINAAFYNVNNENFTWRNFGAEVLGGVVSGVISGFGSGAVSVVQFASPWVAMAVHGGFGVLGSIVGSVIENGIKGTKGFWNFLGEVGSDAVWGGIGGAIGGLMSFSGIGAASINQITKIFKKPIEGIAKKFFKEVGQGIIEEGLLGFSYWLVESGVDYFINNIKKYKKRLWRKCGKLSSKHYKDYRKPIIVILVSMLSVGSVFTIALCIIAFFSSEYETVDLTTKIYVYLLFATGVVLDPIVIHSLLRMGLCTLDVSADAIIWKCPFWRTVRIKPEECIYVGIAKLKRTKAIQTPEIRGDELCHIYFSDSPITQEIKETITKYTPRKKLMYFLYSDELCLQLMEILPSAKTIELSVFYHKMQALDKAREIEIAMEKKKKQRKKKK